MKKSVLLESCNKDIEVYDNMIQYLHGLLDKYKDNEEMVKETKEAIKKVVCQRNKVIKEKERLISEGDWV